jgi:hypothetical protein
MNEQDGAVEQQQQIPPEILKMLQQKQAATEQQPVQRNLTIGGLSLLIPALSDLEFAALQGDLQVIVNYWLRAKGLLI